MSSSSILEKVSEEELSLLPHKDCVRFALFCAEQVRDSWKDIPECFVAIETTERWLEGKASAEECRNATHVADAARYAAHYANTTAYDAYYAAYAAAYAAYAASAASDASDAAYAAARAAHYATATYAAKKSHLIEAQWEYYNELLHFDDIAEKLLLGGVV